MTDISPPALALIDRLSGIDRERPRVCAAAVEGAFAAHFRPLRLEPLRLHWVVDAEAGYVGAAMLRAHARWAPARRSVVLDTENRLAAEQAWSPARYAAWTAMWTPVEREARAIAERAARDLCRRGRPTPTRAGPCVSDWTAARAAAKAVGWVAAASAATVSLDTRMASRQRAVWEPFVNAYEAGLWIFWVMEGEVIAVPRPALRSEHDRLHSASGPAVSWPDGARYYFWHGLRVPERMIVEPDRLTAREIIAERNAEIRRAMLERMGYDRFLLELGAVPAHTDEFGALYRVDVARDEPLALVHVTNATLEPDGTRRRYFLRVPPTVRTARAAVAWTFGLGANTYRPVKET